MGKSGGGEWRCSTDQCFHMERKTSWNDDFQPAAVSAGCRQTMRINVNKSVELGA